MDAFEISASAMTAQRLRLDVIASKLANVNTTRQADGSVGPYRRRNVVFAPIMQQQMMNFPGGPSGPAMMGNGPRGLSFENGVPTLKATFTNDQPMSPEGVRVVAISEDTHTPFKMVYDPSHPDANGDGYVALPNINPVSEMVDMIAATRAYEANVTSIQSTKAFGRAAMEI